MTLPEGWVGAELAELTSKVGSGATPRGGREAYGGGSVPLIRSMNVRFEGFDDEGLAYLDDDQAAALSGVEVHASDVLLNITGASIGRTCLAPDEMSGARVNQHVCIIRLIETLPRFVKDYLASPEMQRFILEENYGLTRQALTKSMIEGIRIPLPPAAEQRRIVAKLDALTARLARARAELDRVPVLAEQLRISALRGVFHWKDDLPPGWTRERVDQIGTVQLGRQRSPKDHHGTHMRPYVRSANVTWTGWDLTDVKEMNFSPDEFATFVLKPGDVLLNEGSGSAKEVGKPLVWKGEIDGACFQNTLLRVRPTAYLPELLRYALLYMAKSGKFIENTQGVNIIHIGKTGLAKTIIPVPPVAEQESLLQSIDRAFARADRLEAEAARARALIDRLESAILARAFRGELVPQDPNDEPASVLLDRIRAERAAAPKAKRGRRAKRTHDDGRVDWEPRPATG